MQLIVGNWKDKEPVVAPRVYMPTLSRLTTANSSNTEVAVCPPLRLMASVREAITGLPLQIGSQDCTLPQMAVLASLGCWYVIIGHSDLRRENGSDYTALREKLVAAIAAQLRPIFCIGESDGDDNPEATLAEMLKPVLGLPDVIVAYEPIWAIGTGRVASLGHIAQRLSYIKRLYPEGRTLYGGSVNPANAGGILAIDEVDGVLVGEASLDAASFASIANAARQDSAGK